MRDFREKTFIGLGALLAFWTLSGCAAGPTGRDGACAPPACRLSLVAGPGDGAYVPGALEATAAAFLGPGSGGASGTGTTTGPTTGPTTGTGTGFPRLRLDRDTLSPGSGTAFRVPRNRSLGLRAEISHPLGGSLRAYAALSAGVGQHDYLLPQGLGPLVDPMRIGFRTLSLTPEAGLVHIRPLPVLPGAHLRLKAGAGVALTRTRTHLTSALLDVSSRKDSAQPYLSLGAGLLLDPEGPGQLELAAAGRLGKGGKGVLRGEVRLSR